MQKYEREAKEKNRDSWYLAFIMDTSEEERAKGKTVEVGRAHFATPAKRYTILDAPGHKVAPTALLPLSPPARTALIGSQWHRTSQPWLLPSAGA